MYKYYLDLHSTLTLYLLFNVKKGIYLRIKLIALKNIYDRKGFEVT